jgi:hypothetical protein
MSWSVRGLLLNADWSAECPVLFKTLGLIGGRAANRDVSFHDVPSLKTSVAVGCVDGWTTLWSKLALDYLDPEAVKRLSKTSDILMLTWQGAVGLAEFAWWSGGSLVRWRLVCEGDVEVDVGKPLPQEARAFAETDDDEERLWVLMGELAVNPFHFTEATRLQVYDFPSITAQRPMSDLR